MLRETDVAKSAVDALQEVAPAPPETATDAQFATEGEVPAVAAGLTAPGATASELAFGAKPASNQIDAGMFTPEEYQVGCLAAGTPEKWDPRYVIGHTAAKQWDQPYETNRDDPTFELKRGESASQAVADFLKGPTIGSFRIIHVALEMQQLISDIGYHKFDETFGSNDTGRDAQIPLGQRLKITPGMYGIPFVEQMKAIVETGDEVEKTEEPEAPAVAAQLEQQPAPVAALQPAPELIAEELGIQREQERA